MSNLDLLRERVFVNIPLQTQYTAKRSFAAAVFVDDDLIPTDSRRLEVAGNGFSDTVGTSGTLYDMCLAFFQNANSVNPEIKMPESVYFCRLIETASSPAFALTDYETDYTVYKSVSDGTIRVTDGTNDDDLTGLDFSSVNSWADVLAVFNAALAALTPNITGLATALFSVGADGRLFLTNSTTGAAAATISLEAVGSGTDLSTSTYLDVSTGTEIAGLDAETLLEGYNAVKDKFDDFWAVAFRGGDDSELIAVARQLELEERFLFTFEDTGSAATSAGTSDLAYVLKNTWNLKRCSSTFSYTEPYPEIAQMGGALGSDEGSCAFGFTDLTNVVTSGQAANEYRLTKTQRDALDDKNYNWIEAVSGYVSVYPGRTVQGQEIRLYMGKDWISATIQSLVYQARIERRILGYDNDSLTVYEEIVTAVLKEARDKRHIIQSFVITMPTEDDFTAADKADHIIELDVFTAVAVIDAWRYEISGRITSAAA